MTKPNELQAGVFVVLSLLLIVTTIFTLGKERQIFSSHEVFYTAFKDVKGLKEGAVVRLGGITIGRVAKIYFGQEPTDPLVYVDLEINNNYLDRIRKDSSASINTQGLLGDRFLTISSGIAPVALPPQGLIESQEVGEIADLLDTAANVANNVTELTKNLNDILSGFKDDAAGDLTKTVKNLAELTDAITNGKGIANSLIFSEDHKDSLIDGLSKIGKSLVKSTDSLAEILSADSIKGDEKVKSYKLLVAETLKNLHRVSESLAGGKGTLGALLLDSQLYDNIVEITSGAKRSFILRSAIRQSLNSKKEE